MSKIFLDDRFLLFRSWKIFFRGDFTPQTSQSLGALRSAKVHQRSDAPKKKYVVYGVFSSRKKFGQLLTNCWPSPWWIQKCPQKWVSDLNMWAFLNTGVGSPIFRWKTAQTHMYRSHIPPGPLYGLYFENRKTCFVKNRENSVFWPFWAKNP